MAFQVSPGVEINEVDLTNVVPAVSTSIGAIAGAFAWGPVDRVVQVGSENQLVDRFFEPNDTTFKYFLPAAQFLQYANDLRVVRAEQDGMLNSTSGAAGVLVKNEEHYETVTFDADQQFVSKYPGELGDSIGVYVVTNETAYNDSAFSSYADLFDFAPGTSDYAD